MTLSLCVFKRLVFSAATMAFPLFVLGQTAAVPQGNESSLNPSVGDQVHPSLSLNQNGGYLVWEENGSLKSGTQISAVRLNSSFAKISSFTVNKIVKGDQVNAQVQLLSSGDALFVWQGYGLGNADIYARLLKDDGTFATGDVRVNSNSKPKGSYSKDQQSAPVISALQDGGAVVAWQSLGQDGSMMGIYASLISASGSVSTNEFRVNQTTAYNQRTPAVATLADGNFVVAWVSEQQRFLSYTNNSVNGYTPLFSVDVYARLFSGTGAAISGEILLNSGNNHCANPSVAALSNGGFTVAWSERDLSNRSNNWDVIARSFSGEGVAVGGDFKINTFTYGDQFCPKIAASGNNCVVVWTSLGQDGSREGVFGRVLEAGTQPSGAEFRVNNTTVSQQIHPALTSDGAGNVLVTWSSFGAFTGFDLFTRKFILNQQQ